jgi:hypothetical protein
MKNDEGTALGISVLEQSHHSRQRETKGQFPSVSVRY